MDLSNLDLFEISGGASKPIALDGADLRANRKNARDIYIGDALSFDVVMLWPASAGSPLNGKWRVYGNATRCEEGWTLLDEFNEAKAEGAGIAAMQPGGSGAAGVLAAYNVQRRGCYLRIAFESVSGGVDIAPQVFLYVVKQR